MVLPYDILCVCDIYAQQLYDSSCVRCKCHVIELRLKIVFISFTMSAKGQKDEKADLIDQFISLKQKYQELFYTHEQTKSENEHLKQKICELKKENEELKSSSDTNVHRENKQLIAKVKQMRRSSCALIVTPQKSPTKCEKQSKKEESEEEYEVEQILKHRGKKGNREFRVRWKNYDKENDTWEKESVLSCPVILNAYKKKHRIA